MFKFEEFTLIGNLTINFGLISISFAALLFFFARYPHKFERLIAWANRFLKWIIKGAEYRYIKYDIQSRLNEYIALTAKKAPHLDNLKANIEWVDENQNRENYIKNGQLIIRMQKSDNQNKNIVTASMAFIATAFLKKAKSYVAPYQRDAIDLYACYDLFKNQKRELLDQFTQDFLKDNLTNTKIGDFFEKFMDIDKAGLFYPVFVQEMTFFGEKVFTRKRDATRIYEEIRNLVIFLYSYSQKKLGEDIISEFNGQHCKFSVRIIGKSYKIATLGEQGYKTSLNNINKDVESIYLLGALKNKDFVNSVFNKCKEQIQFEVLDSKEYKSVLKDREGNDMVADTYLLICRKNSIKTVHRD